MPEIEPGFIFVVILAIIVMILTGRQIGPGPADPDDPVPPGTGRCDFWR